jgi:tetratricopeptide (TPR) repeat protein
MAFFDEHMGGAGSASAGFAGRPDRVGRYLREYAASFAFDAFSDAFLDRGDLPFLRGVPIPLRAEDFAAFRSREGLPMARVAGNMARVVGASPSFPHAGAYIEFLRRFMGGQAASVLADEAKDAAARGSRDEACILFRAALSVEPRDLDAMYGYASVCRAMYMAGGDGAYIGRFKAEALEYFELTTEAHPGFPEAYYYLGYAYLNMGLYQKARLAWRSYLERSSSPEERREIKGRLRQLEDPVKIERGCNAVSAGRFEEGRAVLEPYLKGGYGGWWPLYYYLGVAYAGSGRRDEAEGMFKRGLELNPSHVGSMDELADIYGSRGERDLSEKYRKKAELLRNGGYVSEGSEEHNG